MDSEPQRVTLPFVWPTAAAAWDREAPRGPTPFQPLAEVATGVFGVVTDLTETGTGWLLGVSGRRPELKCRLVVAVYPACATQPGDLAALLAYQQESSGHAEFRILAWDGFRGGLPNGLCWLLDTGGQAALCLGPAGDFGHQRPSGPQGNLVLQPEAAVLEAWRKWFDELWCRCAELNEATAAIPSLVSAAGSLQAAAVWRAYADRCRLHEQAEPPTPAGVTSDEQSGGIIVQVGSGNGHGGPVAPEQPPVVSPTEALGVPVLDEVGKPLAELYARGALVTFDKASRIPPLDAPIRAEWFGLESLRQEGSVRREIKYRISVLDEPTLKKLESQRTKAREVLDRLSFSMGDNMRWMPSAARELFEAELTRVNEEGRDLVLKAVGPDAGKFVNMQAQRVERDLIRMYQDFFPGQQLSKETVGGVLADLTERLSRALGEHLLPKVTYSPVQFAVGGDSEWESPWGQALVLLRSIGEYPRKALTDAFFLRGLRVDHDELFAAMDVCQDHIRKNSNLTMAQEELKCIERVMGSPAPARDKCQALLNLMAGLPLTQIGAVLDKAAKASHQADSTAGEKG